MTGLHVSISAETIFHLGPIPVSNSMFSSMIVSAMLILFAVIVRIKLKHTDKPTGIQNVAEWIVEALHNLIYSVTGDLQKSRRFFGFVATFFLFILLNNWLGLLPGFGTIGFVEQEASAEPAIEEEAQVVPLEESGSAPVVAHSEPDEQQPEASSDQVAVATTDSHSSFVPVLRAGTADLNTTLALALISVAMIQVYGVQFVKFSYFKKFINFSNPINFFVGMLEMISEFGKIISFAFRLFGNIFAGEVLLVVISALIPIIVPMPFYGLELFVGLIQALVFTMLSLVFYNIATQHAEH